MHQRKLKFILMIVAITIIHASAIRVDSNTEMTTKASESVDKPNAEALTLFVHKFPQGSSLRRVIAPRSDDVVHVYHTSRPKRKPSLSSSRKRRPSNQYRSKIKTSSSSNFGGFKDYNFPSFPTKTSYGEPPRASNKYKFGPPTKSSLDNYNYNAQSSNKKSKKNPPQAYGPPPSYNKQFDTNYNHLTINPSSPFDSKTLQTLQQQQANFPSFSIDTVEPSSSNFHGSTNNQPFHINNFPLETGPSYNSQKTSYGNPVRGNVKNFAEPSGSFATAGNFQPSSSGNFQSSSSGNFQSSSGGNSQSSSAGNFQPNSGNFYLNNLNSNLKSNLNSGNFHLSNVNSDSNSGSFNLENLNPNLNSNSNFPKLPARYEPKEFSTPTRPNPLSANQFLTEFTNFNEVSELQNVQNQLNKNRNRLNNFNNFNKFNNFDYDFKGQKNSAPENDDDGDEDYSYTSTTTRRPKTRTTTTQAPSSTKRPKKAFGKRKRPGKISQNHNLDVDDLRDAFTESSDFHEVQLSSDDFINNFDSQRHRNREKNPPFLHEIHSTLKTSRKQNSASKLASALGEDFVNSQIVSIHKSLEKDPNDVDFESEYGFQRKNDNVFSVGSEIRFDAAPAQWSGDFKNFPKNHRFS